MYCVYILKNKVLYVFITLIIVIKKPAIFNMWFGGIFVVCFLVWGFCLFLFCFSGQKKKSLLFSVCTAAGQDVKILKCF